MKKLILSVAVSLDGFIEGPEGEYDWCFTDQDYGMREFFGRIDSVFYGRKSYELTLSMGEAEMPGMPKFKEYVFSNTLTQLKPGAVLVNGDIAAMVKAIKAKGGKDIWLFGGASLTASLMKLGLVDELSLAVHPVLLGAGKPLFQDLTGRTKVTLKDTKTYSAGLVSLTYNLTPEPVAQAQRK